MGRFDPDQDPDEADDGRRLGELLRLPDDDPGDTFRPVQHAPFHNDRWYDDQIAAAQVANWRKQRGLMDALEADLQIAGMLAGATARGLVGDEWMRFANFVCGLKKTKAYQLAKLADPAIQQAIYNTVQTERENARLTGKMYAPKPWTFWFRKYFPKPPPDPVEHSDAETQPEPESLLGTVPVQTVGNVVMTADMLASELVSVRAERDVYKARCAALEAAATYNVPAPPDEFRSAEPSPVTPKPLGRALVSAEQKAKKHREYMARWRAKKRQQPAD
jgi:hypothetical protein